MIDEHDEPSLGGYNVVLTPYLTEAGDPYEVRRTWRERLFSRPWRPLRRTRTVVPQVPMKGGVVMDGQLHMHPEEYRAMQALLDAPIRHEVRP